MRIASWAGRTDPGRKRRRNEDAYVCEPPLFAIADGMGGAQAGELASALASEALREGPNGEADERVAALVQEANRRVFERASEDASASGMGTTVTLALVDEPTGRVLFGHVGDSRAYLIRGGSIEQLTDDHSLVAELVRSGRLSPEEAETHPQRSVITRVLGTDPVVDVDTFAVEARPGDVFLLCSDGLSTMVGDREILDVVDRHRDDLDRSVQALLNEANRGGGEDNITVVLFEIGDSGGDAAPGAGNGTEDTVVTGAVREPDDEDTLSPLDGLRAEDVEAAATEQAAGDATPPGAGAAPGDTIAVPPEEIPELRETAPPPAHVPFWRRLLALLVIAALVGVIAVLVVWGLAR